MSYKSRALARELIAQQTPDFAERLTALWGEVLACASAKEAQNSKALASIVDLIQKRVGLNLNLVVDTLTPPACLPLLANPSHVLSVFLTKGIYNEQTRLFEKAIKGADVKKGTIDLKNGKLGGVYSQIESPIWMGFHFCKKNFTPAEAAAVLMHEVGHLFLAYEMMYRTIRASQVLAGLHQVRTGRDDTITYEHALELSSKELLGTDGELIDCVTMQNDAAIASVVFARVYQKMASDFNENSVAGVNFEVLADNFAAKWGYAKDLVSGLSKLYGNTGLGRSNPFVNFLIYISPILSSMLMGGWLTLLSGLALPASVLLCMAANFVSAGRGDAPLWMSASQVNVYDKPFTRLQRIRETTVTQLKTLQLTNEQRNNLLAEVSTIDQMLAGGKDLSTIFDDMKLILSNNRRAEFAFKLERDMEQLTNNDLFVGAQRLRQAATA